MHWTDLLEIGAALALFLLWALHRAVVWRRPATRTHAVAPASATPGV